jgi:hypothetical protein
MTPDGDDKNNKGFGLCSPPSYGAVYVWRMKEELLGIEYGERSKA